MIILAMISIHKMEHDNIIQENKSLKLIITRALGYKFKEELPTVMTIEELTLENKLLHSRIQQLEIKLDIELEKNKQHEQRIQSLESDNAQLKIENVQLKEEIKELKAENKSLHDKVDELIHNNVYQSYVMAIQDMNSYQQLQSKLPKHKKNLYKLRSGRNTSCHYIDVNEDEDLKKDRLTVLHDKLINMDTSLRCKFDKEFPNLIDDLIQYIEPLKTIPSEDNLEIISYWWE